VSPISLRWRAVAAAVLLGTLAAACNTHTERPPNREQLIAQGELIYVEYCAECHQTDGEGWSTLYPRLAGNPLVTLHDPEPIIVTVTYGLGSMPGFQRRLNSQQIAAVITYVRSAWGNEAAPVSPRQIK
jgi:mono/diheme cytochrome c family protein